MKNVVLHQGIRMDNGKEITGFLTKKFGQYHIVLEENDNTAYPVEEDSIKLCLEGKGLVKSHGTGGMLMKKCCQGYKIPY